MVFRKSQIGVCRSDTCRRSLLTIVLFFIDSLAMNSIPASQIYLESLTTRELIKLADAHSIDIPPDLDRVFIIEELLELAAYHAMDVLDIYDELIQEPQGKFPESAALPKQYNITFIETLVRDPLWVYAYWEVKGSDREVFEKASDFNGYFLNVIPGKGLGCRNSGGVDIFPDKAFTVAIEPEDNARYLGFPPADEKSETDEFLSGVRQRCYRIELYAKKGEEAHFLAASEPFKLPALSPRAEKKEILEKFPLIRMSGIEVFNIIRSADREARIKRGGNFA